MGSSFPLTFIFFKMVQTTNQLLFIAIIDISGGFLSHMGTPKSSILVGFSMK